MTIEEVKMRAKKVAAEHAILEATKAAKRVAQVEYLRSVVAAVMPALPAICSRIPNIPGPPLRAFNAAHGLYLNEQGQWLESYQGGSVIVARDDTYVAEHFCAEDVADAISVALIKHAGSRESSVARIADETDRLRAATLLLKGAV